MSQRSLDGLFLRFYGCLFFFRCRTFFKSGKKNIGIGFCGQGGNFSLGDIKKKFRQKNFILEQFLKIQIIAVKEQRKSQLFFLILSDCCSAVFKQIFYLSSLDNDTQVC